MVSLAFAFALASHLIGGMFVWGMEKAMYGSESDGMDEQNARPEG